MSNYELPETQRTWSVVRRGTPSEALRLDERAPVPLSLRSGDVLVKVQAAALNPIGHKFMKFLSNFVGRRPFTAENDISGIIVDAGDSTDFKVGDHVFGAIAIELQRKTRQGALTEYTRIPASHLAPLPANTSFTGAAGFAIAGETAYQALFKVGKLKAGQSVFVNGGSSSVGAYAIQIAKAKGCRVVASASGKNEDFVKGLGADEFLDYTKTPLQEQLASSPPSPTFDLIFDAIGLDDGLLYAHSPAYLSPDGCFVSTLTPSPDWQGVGRMLAALVEVSKPRWLGGTPRNWRLVAVTPDRNDLYALRDLIAEGKLRPVVDSVFSFEDTLKAYERLMSNRARGKVVVKVDRNAE